MTLDGLFYVNEHKNAGQVRDAVDGPVELGATIRHPEDRLVSIMNHLWGGNSDVSEEEGLGQAIEADGQIWRSALQFIDGATRLFPFEGLPILRWLGCTSVPHENASRKRWSVAQLRYHPLWHVALANYEVDWQLYEMAQKQPGCVFR